MGAGPSKPVKEAGGESSAATADATQYQPVADGRGNNDGKVGMDDPCTGVGWTVSGFASGENWVELSGLAGLLDAPATQQQHASPWAAAGDVGLRGGGLDLSKIIGSFMQSPLHKLQPTSISTFVFAISLVLQCIGAPLLATTADMHGLHLEMYAAHVLLGVTSCFGLAFGQPPLGLQATLVVVLYFAFQITGMFNNAFLPVVASNAQRSSLSLSSSAVSAVGGAGFLVIQYLLLENAADDALSQLQAMQLVCAIAAAMWLVCFLPAFSCLIRVRRPAPKRTGLHGGVFSRLQSGIFRLRQRTHTARFVLAQTFYLAGATSDAAIATIFAQEVVGMSLSRITLVAFISALFGTLGALVTLRMARCVAERPLLMGLMCCPAVLMAYASTFLASELELWVVSCLRAFVAGGLGFQGLNRGAFAKMIPAGREAEFFGLWMVAISSTSWVGPLVQTFLMQLTQSVQLAAASGLVFYVPAILMMAFTSFDLAHKEAAAGTSLVSDSLSAAGAASSDEDAPRRSAVGSALAGKGNEARLEGAPVGRSISAFFATTFQPINSSPPAPADAKAP